MKSISLGQYYPAKSVLHRLDPRMKLILAVLYIVCAFLCGGAVSYAILFFSAFLLILLGRIPFRVILRALKPVVLILVFTVVFNLFWARGEEDPLLTFWIFKIYASGIWHAGFMMVRIFALIIGSCMFLTYTTTPIALTDAIERVLSPLKVLHVPVHELAMMMTIALRFIPTLVEETEKIMAAQKARGADFTTGGLIKRAKAIVPIIVPLFVSAFRRAEDLATAMECRCYHGGEGRTRMTVLHLHARDLLACVVMILFGTLIVLCNVYFAI